MSSQILATGDSATGDESPLVSRLDTGAAMGGADRRRPAQSLMLSKQIVVKGRVQGVGFRYFVYRLARQLGVVGWVRNLPDGNVEIVVQGDEEPMQEFLRQVQIGPPLARVQEATPRPIPLLDVQDFSIKP